MSAARVRVLTHLPLQEPFTGSFPEVEFLQIPAAGEIPAEASGEVLLTFAWGSPNLGEAVKRGVRWVHTLGTGVDRFPLPALAGQLLTCSRGASAVPISEWVLAVMLAFEKRLPESWIHEPPERWSIAELGGLSGKTLGLVGFGGIAQAVATRALAFGMRVRAQRRTSRPSPIPAVELVADLSALVSSADHLVVAASATPATRHLLGREAFSRAKPGLHLVNIARGSLVDQDALREALDGGRVARASLDVVDPEPLPAGHWLYAHPKVRLSAHISWSMPGAIPLLFESFALNLRRFLAGEALLGQVDLGEGY